ncbi:NAD(+) synthase [Sedimentibacter sp. zth1]|uniref:NAD(+) synthase n=1 Tax=Sedimentibacter sp. zth1 TaxID=2816908 RepID=UPI001A92A7ED|nr:NAD(+) synthase [Sedimentibacter sp. zth1]QSX07080.1 NAD(+) synthase [Sedimentibacter sp. zth1]
MKGYNFVRVGAAVPKIEVANCKFNIESIFEIIKDAEKNKVMVLNFPELCVTGYTCADLFYQASLIDECENSINDLLDMTSNIDMLIVVGAPVKMGSTLYNCAIAMYKGKILCIVPKSYLPNYGEFYEKRWFSMADDLNTLSVNYCGQNTFISTKVLIQHETIKDLCIGIEICEDLWSAIAPSTFQTLAGASLILNLSASNDYVGKGEYRKAIVESQSSKCMCAYIYSSAGFGESSTDLVFGGQSVIYENGLLLAETEKYKMVSQYIYTEIDTEKLATYRQRNNTFADCAGKYDIEYEKVYFNANIDNFELTRLVDATPFIPKNKNIRNERCNEIFNIQISGLAKRIEHISAKALIVGISGGLDSTLALLVCAKTCDKLGLDRKMIKAITMPGFGTTDRTYNNSVEMIKKIGATFREINITNSVLQHFKDIKHDLKNANVVYENSQARERTQILMDIANQEGGFVIGTGDLSELALGWATYNGDQMSMYGVNASIPKTLIRYIIKWIADNEFNDNIKNVLLDVLDTPVSPELLPPDKEGKISQKTEEIVGPYELHDFFIYNVLRFGYRPDKVFYLACKAFEKKYDKEIIYKWLKNFYYRFFSQQYKRTCMPDGPKVGSVCLSPRGDLRMPTDASVKIWIDQMENISL